MRARRRAQRRRPSTALTAKIVCGAANNQLAHPGIEKALADRGILYAPDYCVNAGGVIQVADELQGFGFERAEQRASGIFETTRRGLRAGPADGVTPDDAADRLAERRMRDVGRLRGVYLPQTLTVTAYARRFGSPGDSCRSADRDSVRVVPGVNQSRDGSA